MTVVGTRSDVRRRGGNETVQIIVSVVNSAFGARRSVLNDPCDIAVCVIGIGNALDRICRAVRGARNSFFGKNNRRRGNKGARGGNVVEGGRNGHGD